MVNAREEILTRIRRKAAGSSAQRAKDYAAIPRQYTQSGTLDAAQRRDLFAARLEDYGCNVFRCSEVGIAAEVGSILKERNRSRLLASAGVPPDWLPANFKFFRDAQFLYGELDTFDGVITGCALAIASTGTIVLRHSHETERRAVSLIPDYHLCVVLDSQLVELVTEGVRRMTAFGADPVTTISGPSATSDIEMTRIKGVHGPRTLDVILVAAE